MCNDNIEAPTQHTQTNHSAFLQYRRLTVSNIRRIVAAWMFKRNCLSQRCILNYCVNGISIISTECLV